MAALQTFLEWWDRCREISWSRRSARRRKPPQTERHKGQHSRRKPAWCFWPSVLKKLEKFTWEKNTRNIENHDNDRRWQVMTAIAIEKARTKSTQSRLYSKTATQAWSTQVRHTGNIRKPQNGNMFFYIFSCIHSILPLPSCRIGTALEPTHRFSTLLLLIVHGRLTSTDHHLATNGWGLWVWYKKVFKIEYPDGTPIPWKIGMARKTEQWKPRYSNYSAAASSSRLRKAYNCYRHYWFENKAKGKRFRPAILVQRQSTKWNLQVRAQQNDEFPGLLQKENPLLKLALACTCLFSAWKTSNFASKPTQLIF